MPDADYQEREALAVKGIKKAIPNSLKKNSVSGFEGMFAEVYENKSVFPNHYCACAIDGVGTKLLVADALGRYDTVGIDLVAMSANDLVTLGPVSPFLFIDYFAVQEKVSSKCGEMVKGIVRGLEECDASEILRNDIHVNFGKGETASVDEMLSSFKPGWGFDIAGGMIGFIEKEKVMKPVRAGDVIIALKSSGPHSNGYTDLRHVLLSGDFETRKEFRKNYRGKYSLDDDFDGKTIGSWLLEPTKIYVKPMVSVSSRYRAAGINNTGYGLKNLNRLSGCFEFSITDPIEPQPIFKLVQKESGYSDEEMYRKFNMGMGFFIICGKEDAHEVLKIAKDDGAKAVGSVIPAKKKCATIRVNGKKMVYQGY